MRREDILDYEIMLTNDDGTDTAMLVVDVITRKGQQYAILQGDEAEAADNPFLVTILQVFDGEQKGEVEFAWVEDEATEKAVLHQYADKVKKQRAKQREQAREWFAEKYKDAIDGK